MTSEQFKKLKPEYADLQGESLLKAMEDYMVRLTQGYEVTKIVLPFWKRYTFRWLFYRRLRWTLDKPGYQSDERCVRCKKGVGVKYGFQLNGKLMFHCQHCWQPLEVEPNRNIDYRLHVIGSAIGEAFWWTMDKVHLVRSSHYDRYDMFGDEMRYVEYYGYSSHNDTCRLVLRSRKWWEYIFIERNFKPKIK